MATLAPRRRPNCNSEPPLSSLRKGAFLFVGIAAYLQQGQEASLSGTFIVGSTIPLRSSHPPDLNDFEIFTLIATLDVLPARILGPITVLKEKYYETSGLRI